MNCPKIEAIHHRFSCHLGQFCNICPLPFENSDGNTNVRFHQKDTLKRFFERFEQNKLMINRFRADCGSCSEEIVEEIAKHCKTFYIRANRCSSLYNDIFALRGWKTEEL